MDLLRTERVPEWETINPDEWNKWQQRAAETNGWDTPGNRETLKGLVASLAGVWFLHKDNLPAALGLLTYGRIQDLRDGAKAAATGTKSPLGEAFDATSDKIVMAAALPVLARQKILNKPEVIGLVAQHGIASLATITAKVRHQEIHPSRYGKISTFSQWVALGLIGVGKVLPQKYELIGDKLETAGRISLTLGTALGAIATAGYIKDAMSPPLTSNL